jgi:hypothetical protein
MEQFGYIKARDGSPIYAVYHAPAQAEAACPILICPPLTSCASTTTSSGRETSIVVPGTERQPSDSVQHASDLSTISGLTLQK